MNTPCTSSPIDIAEFLALAVPVLVAIAAAIAWAVARRKRTSSDRPPRKHPERKTEVRLIVPR